MLNFEGLDLILIAYPEETWVVNGTPSNERVSGTEETRGVFVLQLLPMKTTSACAYSRRRHIVADFSSRQIRAWIDRQDVLSIPSKETVWKF